MLVLSRDEVSPLLTDGETDRCDTDTAVDEPSVVGTSSAGCSEERLLLRAISIVGRTGVTGPLVTARYHGTDSLSSFVTSAYCGGGETAVLSGAVGAMVGGADATAAVAAAGFDNNAGGC